MFVRKSVDLLARRSSSHIVLPPDTEAQVPLLLRKIGYGTRNLMLGPAMSQAQAVSALHARGVKGVVVACGPVEGGGWAMG